jgi:hypothetical protein
MRSRLALASAIAALFVAMPGAGCVNQRDAAAQAVADATATLAALGADAERYAPEQFAAARAAVDDLQQHLRTGDTAGILQALPLVSTQLAALQSAAAQRKSEARDLLEGARSDWTRLAAELPALLNSLQSRLDALGRSAQLPAGVDRALLERARKELEALKAAWARAMASFAAGRVPEAAVEARESRERAQALLDELGANTA